MIFKLDSHPGLTIENPQIELVGTFDDPKKMTFKPTIIFVAKNILISHELPPQPYIKNTWSDADVQNSINNYLKEIEI